MNETLLDLNAITVWASPRREVLYHYNDTTRVVDPTGKAIPISQLHADMAATFSYTDEGEGHLILNEVALENPIDMKPTGRATQPHP